ncbi:hypothetical protein AC1031_003753 [Aphanomyces cochlioides]|nr:hypothetical protein AC1031_003753 [Aphanomyces cochlioides]
MKSTTCMLVLLGLVCVSFVRADCKACVSFGECTAAYRGAPGQSCGVVAGKTCCCPAAAYCASSSDHCLCKANHDPVLPSGSDKPNGAVTSMVFVLLICLGAFLLCRCCRRQKYYEHDPRLARYSRPTWSAQDVRPVKTSNAVTAKETAPDPISKGIESSASQQEKTVVIGQPAGNVRLVKPMSATPTTQTVYGSIPRSADPRVSENAKAGRASQPAHCGRQIQPDASYQPWVYVPPTSHHTTSHTYQSSYDSGNTFSGDTGGYSFFGDSGGDTFAGDS